MKKRIYDYQFLKFVSLRYFKIIIFFIALVSCKTSNINETKVYPFYVGTYTNGESEGVYKYQLDNKGNISKIGLVAKMNNPSFLAKTKDNKTLLAVEEVDEDGTGFVHSFKMEKDTLLFKSKSQTGGAHPCFVTVNDENQVLVANYTGGNIGYLKVDNQHGLTNLVSIQQHKGKGTTDRQQAPHAHAAWFHPANKEIIAADLGTNQLWFSNINDDELEFSKQKTLNMELGAGPRHLTFHPNNKWIYVFNELNNTISLVKQEEGIYELKSNTSTLPKGYKKYSAGADIHISNDGKFVYASNRGHNSLAIFKVDKYSGELLLVGFQDIKGKSPRNFAISPDNNFVLVANQDSNNIVVFKRNVETGKLTFVNEIQAPNPVCILF